MPVNDFEKQVQQKMDELQLRPSGEVWTEVEKRIRKEKQRRRFVLWFFLTGLLLLGGTAWWLADHTGNSTSRSVAQHTTEGSPVAANEPVNPGTDKNNNTGNNTAPANNDVNNGTVTSQQTAPVTTPATGNDNRNIIKPSTGSNLSTSAQGLDVINDQPVIARKGKNVKDNTDKRLTEPPTPVRNAPETLIKNDKATEPLTGKPTDAGGQKPVANKIISTDKTVSPTINKPSADEPKADSVLRDSLVVKINEAVAAPDTNTPSQPVKNKRAKKDKWEFGITAGGGASTTTDGFPIFQFDADKALYYDSNVNPNALSGAYPAAYQLVPSDPEEGPYWQIGAYAKRKLSKRIAVSAGLQYSSFSTTQTIGKYIAIQTNISNSAYSSNVQYYYRSGDMTTYRNHYNYVQVPVALHWQINKGKKLPITWQNGVTVGRLTKSDALIYTPNSNLFYHDNNLLNKTQFSMQSGVSVKLFSKTKHPVSIGALFNYHFSHLQKVQTNGRDNMSSFGVNASWIIKK
jgi:hypothetical protein